MPPDGFRESMQSIQDVYKDYPAAKKTLDKNPNDGAANALMARVLCARKDTDAAVAALKKAEAANYAGPGLAKAYNAVGDVYQNAQKFDDAIAYFQKGLDASKTVSDKAYSLVSIMVCYASDNDMDNAKKFAKQLKALQGAPKDYLDIADQILGGN